MGSRSKRGWPTVAALILVGLIGFDVALDAACDPLPLRGGPLALTAARTAGSEFCASLCVPDCFCCSRAPGAVTFALTPAPGAVVPVPSPLSEPAPTGVRPVPYHPPLPRS